MAVASVGGAVLSAFLQVAFDRLASLDVLNYFRRSKLDDTLPKKLNIMLLSLNTIIGDAEVKQFTDPNVKAWLNEVKDAVFDAEDVLDEIDYELTKRKMDPETQTTVATKVRNFFGASVTLFDKDIQSRMKQVLDNLEFLENRKIVLGLKQGSFGHGVESVRRVPTTSLVDETKICGRDDDKEMIINWLLSDNNNENGSHFSVISIVGMGGLGKTTLAQLVYNDQRLEDKFDLKAWVCVSDDFDVLRVTRTIFEAITNCNDDTKDLNLLQIKLKEKLSHKKFLLMLDDVWNEDYMLWETLQTPFRHGASGSKILVTTRSNIVVSTIQSDKRLSLKLLTAEDSWSLFKKFSFRKGDAPYSHSELEEVGRKISEKCNGLPLALKTMGSLLYTKFSLEEWNAVLKSEIWEEERSILPALRLSYHYLPSHLKRCFAYCSIYPKDYEFEKEHLVQLWMAENILECAHQNKDILYVGEQFFQELFSRSFFQQSRKDDKYFVMHDLFNDLAKTVSRNFCFRLEIDEAHNLSEQTRQVSFLTHLFNASKRFEAIYKAHKLRTFMPLSKHVGQHYFSISANVIQDLLSTCKCLHILCLSGYGSITELPESIGNLKHLRYLDLSWTRIKKLPDSTCLLYCLQTLKLRCCESLEVLPSDLYKLINLCYLDFRQTKVKNMPKKLGNLKKLQVLSSFFVGKCSETNMKQLKELNLRGTLSILELQNVRYPFDAQEANLKNKRYLEDLRLEWCKIKDDSQSERDVLENLQPHKNLKELSIINYGGTRFPYWLLDNTLVNVVILELKNCKYCYSLPPLGLLPCLKSLSITGFDSVVTIDADFYGRSSCDSPFRSLELLRFKKMAEWEEWKQCDNGRGAFPCLQELYIEKCPKFKDHLPATLASLRKLVIKNCRQLEASAPSTPAIYELVLGDCGKLTLECVPSTLKVLRIGGPFAECFSFEEIEKTIANSCLEVLEIVECGYLQLPLYHCHYNFLKQMWMRNSCYSLKTFPLYLFPKLQSLDLEGSSNLERIYMPKEHNHGLTSLTTLNIFCCPKFVSFSEGGFSAPKLEQFWIKDMENLIALPQNMRILFPSLQILTIWNCPKVESFPKGGLPSNLNSLYIFNCPKLIARRMEWDLHALSSLQHLWITDADMECFPEAGLLPPTLTHLCMWKNSSLWELDYKGLCCLSTLKQLDLVDCPKLQCLPKEGLPTSLYELYIRGCPLLENRCQNQKGQDWEKIAHIANVVINDDVVT